MGDKLTNGKPDLDLVVLRHLLNPDHPLVSWSDRVDWEPLCREVERYLQPSSPGIAVDGRLVLGLFSLKARLNLSDTDLLEQWVENLYWQYFCGCESMRHRPPADLNTLARWRSLLGNEHLTALLKKIKDAA
jgi:IS5 family transposase